MTTTSNSPTESLGGLRARLRERLLAAEKNPRDADSLLCHALGRSLTWLIAHSDDGVDQSVAGEAGQMVDRRLAAEPLQYIRGYTEFFGRRFAVDSRVLIPRLETEILVEAAIKRLGAGARVLDVGTGSGCIAISIEREMPQVRVVATDRSIAALALARSNGDELSSRVSFVAADFVAPFRGLFDLLVSNPPYIPADVVEGLAAEVRCHEPRVALTPGLLGTEAFEALLRAGADLLQPQGLLMLEIGFDQAASIHSLASENGWVLDEMIQDLAGISRVVVLSRP
jgi:release factor glutamine methyltransferase